MFVERGKHNINKMVFHDLLEDIIDLDSFNKMRDNLTLGETKHQNFVSKTN